jgi:hypothetical protein
MKPARIDLIQYPSQVMNELSIAWRTPNNGMQAMDKKPARA